MKVEHKQDNIAIGTTLPSWVQRAQKMPLYFSQVREDALIDLQLAKSLGYNLDIIMVASGGCTASALAGSGLVSQLHMVDINPAQLALTRLKLLLLHEISYEERLEILGYTSNNSLSATTKLSIIMERLELPQDTFGDWQTVTSLGLDFCGRYEQLFQQLQEELKEQQIDLNNLLTLNSPSKQSYYINNHPRLKQALRQALDNVMFLPYLQYLFGEGATSNRRQPFSDHFWNRTQSILSTLPAINNPYLHQVFSNQRSVHHIPPWLEIQAPRIMPSMIFSQQPLVDVLQDAEDNQDLIHLSNICDWLSEREAIRLLDRAYHNLKRNGMVVIRQLNSTLDIPALAQQFDWQENLSQRLLKQDRSFFYSSIYVGRKK